MIPDNIILFIIMFFMTLISGNKLYPQLLVVSLATIEIFYNVKTPSTITQDIALQVFLFALNMLYAVLMLYKGTKDEEGEI